MNIIAAAIGVTSVILLMYVLLMRSGRGTNSETHPWEDESPLPSADEESRLTVLPNQDRIPNENVTLSLPKAADQSRCPACGASITANDERCPSCEIAFVADGSLKWTLGNVGSADGIRLPPTDVRE